MTRVLNGSKTAANNREALRRPRTAPPNRPIRAEPQNHRIFPPDRKPSYPWSFKAKKPMTITAGFKVQDGILLCADTMYSGGSKSYATKIFKQEFDGGCVAFALAGTEDCSLMLIQACQKAISESASFFSSTEQIEEVISRTLRRLFKDHELQDAEALFLIAIWTERGGLKLMSTRRGVMVERERYYCNGSGSYLANYLIEPAYHQVMGLPDVIVLATQTLAAVKSYDDGCGGRSELIVLQSDGSLSPVEHEEISTAEQNISGYERYARKLMFDFANPQLSESEFQKKLDSFVETITIGRESWVKKQKQALAIRKLVKSVFPNEVPDFFTPPNPEDPKPDPPDRPPTKTD